MSGELFNRKKLKLKNLSERINDLNLSAIAPLVDEKKKISKNWALVADKIIKARKNRAAVILMMGGHVFRSGTQKHIIDLMEKGYITHLATNGSGMIHDYEFALIGATTESVPKYIKEGQFGLWQETGCLNNIINNAWDKDQKIGMGEAVGKAIEEGDYPYKNVSLFAAAYRLSIPLTVHVGIGYDIIHEHPNCSGAATGGLSYNDFLKFAASVQNLNQGVVMNFGSAVAAPEVYLKALSMARNIAHQKNEKITKFTTLVCDLHALPDDFHKEPDKTDQAYYFRPWKTMLVRTVADGGESFYIKGKHAETIPALWSAINEAEKAGLNQCAKKK